MADFLRGFLRRTVHFDSSGNEHHGCSSRNCFASKSQCHGYRDQARYPGRIDGRNRTVTSRVDSR